MREDYFSNHIPVISFPRTVLVSIGEALRWASEAWGPVLVLLFTGLMPPWGTSLLACFLI